MSLTNHTKEALETVIGSILEVAQKERESKEPYKDLFKKIEGRKNVDISLHEINNKMETHILDAHRIFEKKGVKLKNEAYQFLLALPLMAHLLEKDIQKKEGRTCSVDKVYYLLAQEFEKLIV